MITIMDGRTDEIIQDISERYVLGGDMHRRSMKDALETYEFTTFADRDFSAYLTDRNRLAIRGEAGELREFVISGSAKYRNGMEIRMDVYATASYLDLRRTKIMNPGSYGSWTSEQHVREALTGTEWEVGQVDYRGLQTIQFDSHFDPYNYLKRIAEAFDLELNFRIEHDGYQVTGRYVDLVEQVGEWRGREVTFGKDLIGIRREEKTDEIVTALMGIGPDRGDGLPMQVFVEDIDALERWGRNGQHLIGIYEPQIDVYVPAPEIPEKATREEREAIEEAYQEQVRAETEKRLREMTERELENRISAVVEYETEVADLENFIGEENKKIRFGDTIKIKDTKFNPPLYLEARVHTMDRSLKDKSRKRIILGDYIEYTEEEVLAIWKTLQKEIQDKISRDDIFEYTYDKSTIDEKDRPGNEAKDKIDRDVGEAIIEDVIGSQEKANEAEREAKDYTDEEIGRVSGDIQRAQENIARAEEELAQTERNLAEAREQLEQAQLDIDTASGEIGEAVEEIGGLRTALADKPDWMDVNQAIGAVRTDFEGVISDIQTSISDLPDSILLQVRQEFDDIGGVTPEYVETRITQFSNEISAVYIKDDELIAGVRIGDADPISGANVEISGDTLVRGRISAPDATFIDIRTENMTAVNSRIQSGTITGTLTANLATFNSGTFRNAKIEHAEIIDADITGTLDSVDGTFTGQLDAVDGTFTGHIEGGSITVWHPNIVGQYIFISAGKLEAFDMGTSSMIEIGEGELVSREIRYQSRPTVNPVREARLGQGILRLGSNYLRSGSHSQILDIYAGRTILLSALLDIELNAGSNTVRVYSSGMDVGGNLNVGSRLDAGSVHVGSVRVQTNGIITNRVYSQYRTTRLMLNDFNNGNVSVNAVGGDLILGYTYTNAVMIEGTTSLYFNGKTSSNGSEIFNDSGSYFRIRSQAGSHNGSIIMNKSNQSISFYQNGSFRHQFNSNGTKSGGSIEVDGMVLGMSPTDSPQALIETIEFDIPLSSEGTVVYLDDYFLKAVDYTFAVFVNNGRIVEKGEDYFVVAGEGMADARIVGERYDSKGVYFTDLTTATLRESQ